MPRDRRAADPWPTRSAEPPDPSASEPKWSSLTDTGSMEPSAEALAWQRRADAWAQQADGDDRQSVEPASRWSDAAATGRPTFPADGVGWRTETAEWRATGARWRQTTEWRSTTGSHGWRSTTEAWQTGDSRPYPPAAETPMAQPALSSTAHEPEPDERPSWQQFTSPSRQQPAETPSWQQPAQRPPAESSPSWQGFVEPEKPWQRGSIEGSATWNDVPEARPSADSATGSWQTPRTDSATGSWQTPRTDSWQTPRAEDSSTRVGRRRAPEGGTGWTTRSDTDNWAGHTDTGNIQLYPDPATPEPSWGDAGGRRALPAMPYDEGRPSRAGRRRAAEPEDYAEPAPGESRRSRRSRSAEPEIAAAGSVGQPGPEPDAGRRAGGKGRYNQAKSDDWREQTGSWAAEPDTSNWVRDPDTGQWSRSGDDPRVLAWRREAARREAMNQDAPRRELPAGPSSTPAGDGDAGGRGAAASGGYAGSARPGDFGGSAAASASGIPRGGEPRNGLMPYSDPAADSAGGYGSAPRSGPAYGAAPGGRPEYGAGRSYEDSPGIASAYGSGSTAAPRSGPAYGSARPYEAPPTDPPRGGSYGSDSGIRGAAPYGGEASSAPRSGPAYGSDPAGAPRGTGAAPYGTERTSAFGSGPAYDAESPRRGAAPYGGEPTSGPAYGTDPTPRGATPYGGEPASAPRSGPAYGTNPRSAMPYGGDPTSGPAYGTPRGASPYGTEPTNAPRSGPAYGTEPTSRGATAYGAEPTSAPRSGPAYGTSRSASPYGTEPTSAPRSGPAYGTDPTSRGAAPYGTAPTSGPAYGRAPRGGSTFDPDPPTYGSRSAYGADPSSSPRSGPAYGSASAPRSGPAYGTESSAPPWSGSAYGVDRGYPDPPRGTRPEPAYGADPQDPPRGGPAYGRALPAGPSAYDSSPYGSPPRNGNALPPGPSAYGSDPRDPASSPRSGAAYGSDLRDPASSPRSGAAYGAAGLPATPRYAEDDDFRPGRRRADDDHDDPPTGAGGGRRRAAEPDAGPDAEAWRADAESRSRRQARRLGLPDDEPDSRQRLEPGSWVQDQRDAAARGTYREGSGNDWRRDLAEQADLAEGESKRFGTSDYMPFRAGGSAAVPRSSNLSMTSTSLISPVPREQGDPMVRPQRTSNGYQAPAGSYERRPVTGGFPTVSRRSDLLDPDDEEDEQESGGPLAAVGYTVIWYGVPVVLFVLYMLVINTGAQTHALDTLSKAAPQFGISLLLSILVALGLRFVSHSWKAISVGLAAAVVGGGLATVLTSAITGNSLS